jgi:hypothetical protein
MQAASRADSGVTSILSRQRSVIGTVARLEFVDSPVKIAYRWGDGPRNVTSYAITFVNGSLTSRAPRDWTFEGWNGSSWIVIDTRSAQTSWLGSSVARTRSRPRAVTACIGSTFPTTMMAPRVWW